MGLFLFQITILCDQGCKRIGFLIFCLLMVQKMKNVWYMLNELSLDSHLQTTYISSICATFESGNHQPSNLHRTILCVLFWNVSYVDYTWSKPMQWSQGVYTCNPFIFCSLSFEKIKTSSLTDKALAVYYLWRIKAYIFVNMCSVRRKFICLECSKWNNNNISGWFLGDIIKLYGNVEQCFVEILKGHCPLENLGGRTEITLLARKSRNYN